MKKYLAELLGTMFLVLLACGSAVLAAPAIGILGVGICFGLVLLCLCYAIGDISGCHVNPAVSFAMFLSGKMNAKDFGGYVISQLIGAAIGGALLYWFVSSASASGFDFGGITKINGEVTGSLAANVLQPGATSVLAMLAEVLLTMFFVYVILAATDEQRGAGKFAGVAIGLALGLVNIAGITVDNCSVNPARSFGPALFSQGSGAWDAMWIMIAGPLAGAALAVILYRLTFGCPKCKNA